MGCSRTFSTYTGTALHYLKRIDRWEGFCRAMDRSLTIRETSRLLDLHKDTVFRWRHRFLAALAATERTALNGEVVVAELAFPYCVKGARSATRATGARRSAGPAVAAPCSLNRRPPVWVVIARDERGHGAGVVFGERRPNVAALTMYFDSRTGPEAVIVGGQGRYSPLALCATRLGLRYRAPARSASRRAGRETPRDLSMRLRRWIRRFRGVATRYLENYLLWFRALDDHWSGEAWDVRVVGMN